MLSDWPDCVLEIRCHLCGGRSSQCAVKGLIHWYGDRTFAEILKRIRCKFCRRRPAPVYLCASHIREGCKGPDPDWAIELLPAPEH